VISHDLLVLGDVNPDLVLSGGEVTPAFGQAERVVEGATLTIGGSGGILACGAARLGLRTAFCGVVGDDLFGRFMREELMAHGVDISGLVVDETRPTGVTVVLSAQDDRAMLTAPGSIGELRAAMIDPRVLASARHVHVSSFFLQRALAAELPDLFAGIRARGGTVSLDPNWDPSGEWDGGLMRLLPRLDVFLPNSMEAMRLARISDLDEAIARLRAQTATVVIKNGGRGAIASSLGETVQAHAYRVEVEDSTGAGDSFDAGFLAMWLDGQPMDRCLAVGNACGALSTRAVGGTTGQPTMKEALALVEGGSAA
jgi:sugar/nucleoside kinase (ribokinase family)